MSRVLTSKPSLPRLDLTNRFVKQAAHLFVFNGGEARDLIGNAVLTPVNAVSPFTDVSGVAAGFDKTVQTSAPQYFSVTGVEDLGTDFFVAGIANPGDAVGQNYGYFISNGSFLGVNSLNIIFNRVVVGENMLFVTQSSQAFLDAPHEFDEPTIFYGWSRAAGPAEVGISRFRMNGSLIGTGTATKAGGATTGSTYIIGGREDLNDQRFYDGGINFLIFGKNLKLLTADAAVQFSKDPFQVFKPKPRFAFTELPTDVRFAPVIGKVRTKSPTNDPGIDW